VLLTQQKQQTTQQQKPKNMQKDKKGKKAKKEIKVHDLKPVKDAKGGSHYTSHFTSSHN